MKKRYKADLHIHTCLSPCGDPTMTPRRIIAAAKEKKVDIIAIADHNSADNVEAVTEAGKEEGIVVLGGMEVTTLEEVHVLTIFDRIEATLKLQNFIYKNLIPGANIENVFGEQLLVNSNDEVVGTNKRLLFAATRLTLRDIITFVHGLEGLVIASHIDRLTFGIIGQVGYIPENLNFDALEISSNTKEKYASKRFPEMKRYPIVSSSDAHHLEEIGTRVTSFSLTEPTLDQLRRALRSNHQKIIY